MKRYNEPIELNIYTYLNPVIWFISVIALFNTKYNINLHINDSKYATNP